MTAPRAISGLSEIADAFDAFLVDQFGVLHDGRAAFRGARDCLLALRRLGKRIALVSNSGKRAGPNISRLADLGFESSVYDAFITSGDLCRSHVELQLSSGALRPGSACIVFARDADRSALAGLPLVETDDPDRADLLVILGAAPERLTREDYRALLRPLAARDVPALCANTDLMMYTASGTSWAAGALAQDYCAFGGLVTTFGKPDPAIFSAALAGLGHPAPKRTLVIGDSVEHDLAGAVAVGCPWLHVRGGVQSVDDQILPAALLGEGYLIPKLVW